MEELAELLGDSPTIEVVRDKLRRLLNRQQAGQRLPSILIQGETGTGKGLVARLLHRHSARSRGPFVNVNCAAIPEALLEAELFGFERGAFTDARRAKPGLFQTAHGGVLFLDEIGLLPESLQAKLLTVIEERAVRRLGSTRPEPTDAWVISATNTDLPAAVGARRFRDDLYHRLAVLTLELPPLRDRGRDILLLAEQFLARTCAEYGLPPKRFDLAAQARLLAYAWPGNVRELGNVIERAALLADALVMSAETLGSLQGEGAGGDALGPRAGTATTSDEAMRDHLLAALEQMGGNISHTAARLGIARNTVYARLEKFGLRPDLSRKAAPAPPRPVAPAAEPPATNTGMQWERRSITLLRAELRSVDSLDGWARSSRALEAVIAKTHTFGGRVEEVTPTGLMAAFGLDQAEDAPRRAAHAAIAIQKGAERARESTGGAPEVAIGLHVAPLLVGRVGTRVEIDADAKRAHWPVLDQLLDGRAPGEIFASGEAGTFLERRFEMVPVDEPVNERDPAYRLTGREQRGFGPWGAMTRFVGRREELEVVRSRLGTAGGGRGQVIAVVGEAGVGKSRLIYEVALTQRLDGWRVLETTAVSYGQAMSYLPVIALLKGYFAIQDRDNPREVSEKVTEKLRRLDTALQPTLPAFLALLDVPLDDAAWRALDPPQRRQRTLDAVRRLLLRETREQPLLLIFEDLHWIDSETQALLDGLVETLGSARLLLLVSYRPEYQHAWGSKTSYSQLRLDTLPDEQASEFLDALIGQDAGLAPLKQRLIKHGNPFFLEETVRTLVETHTLDGRRGAYRLTRPVPALQIPPTVQAMLAARIDRLAPADKRLLHTAAVVGKDIPATLLQAIAKTDEATVRAGLERLQAAEFLYEVHFSPDTEYTFKHALTHEAAYGTLLEERRQGLHARIVEAIERLYPDRLAEHVNALAGHAVRGKTWDKALHYCRRAAARDADRRAYREAITAYEQALEALTHLPANADTALAAVDLRRTLAHALGLLGQYQRSVTLLSEAESLARQLEDPAPLGLVLGVMSWARRAMGDTGGALAAASEAVEIARARGDADGEASAAHRLAQVFDMLGEFGKAAEMFRGNVEALKRGPFDPRRSRFLSESRAWLTRVLGLLGEFVDGRYQGEEAVRLSTFAQGTSPILAHGGLGQLLLAQGDFVAAIPVLESGLTLSRAADERAWGVTIAGALGEAYARAGRLAEGLALLEQALSDALQRGALGTQVVLSQRLATVYLLAMRLEEARHHARLALEAARQQKSRGLEAAALLTLGEIHAEVAVAEIPQAETSYRLAQTVAVACGMRPLIAHCHLGLGKLFRRMNSREQAHEHLTTAATMYREMGMTYWLEKAGTGSGS